MINSEDIVKSLDLFLRVEESLLEKAWKIYYFFKLSY